MYQNSYILKCFVQFMEKGGRARGVSRENFLDLFEIWKKFFNSGKNSEVVKAKKIILEKIRIIQASKTSWNRCEETLNKEFIVEFTNNLQSEPVYLPERPLTKSYPQLEFIFDGLSEGLAHPEKCARASSLRIRGD